FGSSFLLPLMVGHARAAELLYLGAPFDAQRALELGLITRVVADGEVLQAAREAARALAAKPARAMRVTQQLLKLPFRDAVQAAMKAETEAFSARLKSPEAKEAMTAFIEKRPPDFTKTKQAAAAG